MYFTEDTMIVDVPTGQQNQGIEAAIMSSAVWEQAFPDASAEVVNVEVNGNTVATTIVGRGTFTGQMMMPDGSVIPGNGSTLDLDYVQTIEVEGNTVVRLEANYDMQDMMSQLGLG
jgi:predicted ester cyclase